MAIKLGIFYKDTFDYNDCLPKLPSHYDDAINFFHTGISLACCVVFAYDDTIPSLKSKIDTDQILLPLIDKCEPYDPKKPVVIDFSEITEFIFDKYIGSGICRDEIIGVTLPSNIDSNIVESVCNSIKNVEAFSFGVSVVTIGVHGLDIRIKATHPEYFSASLMTTRENVDGGHTITTDFTKVALPFSSYRDVPKLVYQASVFRPTTYHSTNGMFESVLMTDLLSEDYIGSDLNKLTINASYQAVSNFHTRIPKKIKEITLDGVAWRSNDLIVKDGEWKYSNVPST